MYLYSYIIILVGLFVGTIISPAIALTSVFLMFSLEQWGQFSSKFLLSNSSFTNISIGIIACVGFLKLFFSKKRTFYNYPDISLYIIILYLYLFTSLQWSPSSVVGFDFWLHYLPYICITVVLAPILIHDEKDVLISSTALQIFGLPLAILLLFFAEWSERRMVISSGSVLVLGNPLEIGTFSATLFVTSVFHKIKNIGKLSYVLNFILIILSAGLLVVSGSRGQFFAVIVTLYILWFYKHEIKSVPKYFLYGFFLIVISALLIYSITIFGGNNIRWEEGKVAEDIAGRFSNVIYLFPIWLESISNIVFGIGNSASYKYLGIYPHNVPAEILIEGGLISFSIYMLIFIKSIRACYNIIKLTKVNTEKRNAGIILSGYMLITFVLSLKQGSFISNMYFFMFAIMLCRYEKYLMRKSHG